MVTHKLIATAPFGADEIKVMKLAYQAALIELGVCYRADRCVGFEITVKIFLLNAGFLKTQITLHQVGPQAWYIAQRFCAAAFPACFIISDGPALDFIAPHRL